MKALIVIAHGSRKASSNEEVVALCEQMNHLEHAFDQVEPSFLELTEPRLPTVIDKLANEGAKDITVLPYFLAAGVHVANDLPALMKDAQTQYKDIEFKLLTHLGSHPNMAKWLLAFAAGE